MDEETVNRNSPWERLSSALNSIKTWKVILTLQTGIICQESYPGMDVACGELLMPTALPQPNLH